MNDNERPLGPWGGWSVTLHGTSMSTFVTSNTSAMAGWHTRAEADAYVERSKSFHPGKYAYHVRYGTHV